MRQFRLSKGRLPFNVLWNKKSVPINEEYTVS